MLLLSMLPTLRVNLLNAAYMECIRAQDTQKNWKSSLLKISTIILAFQWLKEFKIYDAQYPYCTGTH